MTEYENKRNLAENELAKVSGGWYDSGANDSSEVPGGIDYPIELRTESAVRQFVETAQKYEFRIVVYKGGQSVDGKDYEAVLSLDRSGFVHVMAYCRNTDPFARELDRFMVY